MFKNLFIIFICILISSCSFFSKKSTILYVYPDLPVVSQPNILTLNACKFSIPKNDDSIFIGFDKENYKCYLKNQEINREQKLLYKKVIDEMNQERIKWKELNK